MNPMNWLLLPALLLGLFALVLLFGRSGRWLRRLLGLCCVALALLLALLLAALGVSLRQYLRLDQALPVATLEATALGPQRFAVLLHDASGDTRRFEVLGDQWQLDARVLRWQLPALLAGVPPLYRLERLSGRYRDIDQEREAARSVFALSNRNALDLLTLQQQYPQWLPFVDTRYGSGAYLPLIDGGHYEVMLHPRGGLVARGSDDFTRQALDNRE